MQVQPYLFFEGRTEEAVEFYRTALGATDITLHRFNEGPPPSAEMTERPNGDKIMHASFKIGDSTIMASDGENSGQPKFLGIALSVTVSDIATAERLFSALVPGGQIQMPLTQTFFSPRFGMVADRFGVSWMIVVMP